MADMMKQLPLLYELQQVDTAIAAHQAALADAGDGGEAQAKLALGQRKLARASETLKDLKARMRDSELRLKSNEEEQEQKSKQAYGGTVTDPKQLRALEQKLKELARQKGTLEEQILELMTQTEEAEQVVAKYEAAVDKWGKKVEALNRSHASESRRLTEELETLTARRVELVGQLDGALITQYDGLREKLGGLAVAAVHKGSCRGCKVTLPGAYAQRLKTGTQIVRCESCHRILYLPEGESPFTPEDE